ncbi:transposase [Kutzneria buriramensis]|uniref:transposase n=1 Tax=Kutzneria buriramensis TaxID=1045776 RepID=UPI001FE4635B|nr:transposase [Kutzneria buriramensis]
MAASRQVETSNHRGAARPARVSRFGARTGPRLLGCSALRPPQGTTVDTIGSRPVEHLQVQPPGTAAGGEELDDHGLGRSQGGWTTKLHLACEQGRELLALVVTAGKCGDSPQFTVVLEQIRVPRVGVGRPRCRPDRVLADKAYSSRANRRYVRRRGIKATIAQPCDQAAHRRARGSAGGRPPAFDAEIYKQRHAV